MEFLEAAFYGQAERVQILLQQNVPVNVTDKVYISRVSEGSVVANGCGRAGISSAGRRGWCREVCLPPPAQSARAQAL